MFTYKSLSLPDANYGLPLQFCVSMRTFNVSDHTLLAFVGSLTVVSAS